MELKSPTPKRKGNRITKPVPLPVFCDSGAIFDDYISFGTFSGYFNGNSVIVDDPEEIKALYTMGFFGKASLSKGFPSFGKSKKDEPTVLKQYQWERRKEWSNKLEDLIALLQLNKNKENNEDTINDSKVAGNSNVEKSQENIPMDVANENIKPSEDTPLSSNMEIEESNQETFTKEINLSISEAHSFSETASDKNKEVLVINDCNDVDNLQNLNPHLEVESLRTVMEVLYLSLEEAFFLSYALGCLQILDLTGKPLSLLQVWRIFNYSQPDFTESYVAYHYFRAKGWIVKSGIKFGGHFLLYKDGPSFYHASYVVLIENIIPSYSGRISNKEGELTWDKMNSLNRMAETCSKEILICKIQWPEMTDDDKENPLIIKKFKVKEYLLRRWQPCQEKEIE